MRRNVLLSRYNKQYNRYMENILEVAAIDAAYARIGGMIRRTPVLDWGAPGGGSWQPSVGTRLTLKLEQVQITGSFKVRGALNLILDLPDAERARGLVTA